MKTLAILALSATALVACGTSSAEDTEAAPVTEAPVTTAPKPTTTPEPTTTAPPTTQPAPTTTTMPDDPDIVFGVLYAPSHADEMDQLSDLMSDATDALSDGDVFLAKVKSMTAQAVFEKLGSDAAVLPGVEGPFGQAVVTMSATCYEAMGTVIGMLDAIQTTGDTSGVDRAVGQMNDCTADMSEVAELTRETAAKLD